jgi:hypothetical protein
METIKTIIVINFEFRFTERGSVGNFLQVSAASERVIMHTTINKQIAAIIFESFVIAFLFGAKNRHSFTYITAVQMFFIIINLNKR